MQIVGGLRDQTSIERGRMKKASMMVWFLTTLMLAIVITIPFFMVVSNLLRTSSQAKDSFLDFAYEIEQLHLRSNDGERVSEILIMDEDTALVYYPSGSNLAQVYSDVEGNRDYYSRIFKPSQCDDSKNCFCLIRKAELELNPPGEFYGDYLIEITPVRSLCNNFDYELIIDSCSMGQAKNIVANRCDQGFVIERNLMKGFNWNIVGYYENPRRRDFEMVLQSPNIRLIDR